MTLTFQHKLNEELLLSEKKRTIILVCIFSFAAMFRLLQLLFFGVDEDLQRLQSSGSIWLFPLCLVLFEVFSLLYINRRIKTNRLQIPLLVQYANTVCEVCLPSIVILLVAKQFPSFNVLHSPAVFIYFIFITVSTLRLKFWLSFFCGLLSAASYVVFSISIYHHFNSNEAAIATIMLLCGIASGLVAKQIREGINRSIHEAAGRQKIENLFGQQLSAEVAEKMLESNGRFESRKMKVAVLFIDIRNFSKYAACRTPEEIVQYQDAFFSIIINTVAEYKGVVHQFLGDGCMVTFGAPVALENPCRNAVSAAMALKQQLELEVEKGTMPATQIGIGIHYGDAITGNIGTDTRQQYAVTGKVVIIAARLEQLNKQLDSAILITDEVFNNIQDVSPSTNKPELAELKGFEELIKVYKLA
ncbi:MAG: adenylate/guanylate cyclase domain-containing protein [Ferruginibacter sp.]